MRIASPWQVTRRFLIRQVAKLLTKRLKNYTSRCPNDLDELKSHIKKGDVILVEGEQRVSEVIKYLTQGYLDSMFTITESGRRQIVNLLVSYTLER